MTTEPGHQHAPLPPLVPLATARSATTSTGRVTSSTPGRIPPVPLIPPPPVVPPPPSEPPEQPRQAPARSSVRLATAILCVVMGTGLLGGAAAGTWLVGGDDPERTAAFDQRRTLWHELPVEELFPPELEGEGAGPGTADRRWIRVSLAPDSGCQDAFDPRLADALAAAGCHRLLRASYVDETEHSVTTVGLLFTTTDAAGMSALRESFTAGGLATDPELLPRTVAAPDTPAEGFTNAQRATWSLRVLTDLPVVVYTVTGFTDGRAIETPQPATEATEDDMDTAVALAGLGHDAVGIADRVERLLRKAGDEVVDQR